MGLPMAPMAGAEVSVRVGDGEDAWPVVGDGEDVWPVVGDGEDVLVPSGVFPSSGASSGSVEVGLVPPGCPPGS